MLGAIKDFARRTPLVRGPALRTSRWWRSRKPVYWRRLRKALRNEAACFGPCDQGCRILIINHFFDQDIEAILDANTRQRIFVLPYQAIRELATIHLPQRCESDWNDYHDPALAPQRSAYRADLVQVVDRIEAAFPFDVVVTPSDMFFWIRELVPEVQSRGKPFVVIDKEGTITPHFFTSYARQILRENPFVSDHILVWSPRQEKFWQLAGVRPESIHVIGQQRSDFWSRPDKWPTKEDLGIGLRPDAPMLLFYSFLPHTYIPIDIYQRGEVGWDALVKESHEAVLAVAERFPDWDVVIKTHPQEDSRQARRQLASRGGLHNVRLVTGARLSNVLNVRAEVVTGFQTTALIEAMIPGERPIIYAFWGDAKDKWSEEIIPFHKSGALTVATSPTAYREALIGAMSNPAAALPPEQIAARRRFVQEYFWKPNGQAGRRTLDKLEEIAAMGGS